MLHTAAFLVAGAVSAGIASWRWRRWRRSLLAVPVALAAGWATLLFYPQPAASGLSIGVAAVAALLAAGIASRPAPVEGAGTEAGGRVAVLDGIRGIAILGVLVTHSNTFEPVSQADHAIFFWTSMGWTGVILFFVLSGYLITGVLTRARGARDYFRAFYARRALRILPLYYAVVIATFVVPQLVGLDPHAARSADYRLSYLVFAQNFFFLRPLSLPYTLGVTWSLAIEEQFYLVWPLLVLLIPGRRLAHAAAFLVVAALAWRVATLGLGWPPAARYYLMPSMLDGLAAGAAVAAWTATAVPERLRRFAGPVFAVAAVGAVGIGTTTPGITLYSSDPLVDTIGFTVLAVAFAALIALAITSPPTGALHRVLSSRLLRAAGHYSYAAYLLHYFVLEPAVLTIRGPLAAATAAAGLHSTFPAQLVFTGAVIAGTFALAWVTWHYLEEPALALKSRFRHHFATRPAPTAGATVRPAGQPAE